MVTVWRRTCTDKVDKTYTGQSGIELSTTFGKVIKVKSGLSQMGEAVMKM